MSGPALPTSLSASRIKDLLSGITATGPSTTVLTPFTADPLVDLPTSTPADVQAAAAAARTAQRAWAARSAKARAAVLLRLHDLVLARQNALMDVIQAETGKARGHAFEEVLDVAINCRYYGRTAPKLLAPQRRAGAIPVITRTVELRHPLGLTGLITPWNYPLTLGVSDALPALVAGNAVLHKPDTQTVLTALAGRQLAIEAGLPPDLWQVVVGDGTGCRSAGDRRLRPRHLHRLHRDRPNRSAAQAGRTADRLSASSSAVRTPWSSARTRTLRGRLPVRCRGPSRPPVSSACTWSGSTCTATSNTTSSPGGSSRPSRR